MIEPKLKVSGETLVKMIHVLNLWTQRDKAIIEFRSSCLQLTRLVLELYPDAVGMIN